MNFNTQIVAFSTAQEYSLPSLLSVLDRAPGYTLLPTLAADVLHIRDDVAHDVHASGELFVFADGSFVAWGTNAQEIGSRFLAGVLKKAPGRAPSGEKMPPIEVMPSAAVEMEEMEYIEDANETTGLTGDLIIIGSHPPPQLSKLAFSHGLSRSAKIAVLESLLDRYLNSTRHIPHVLAQGHALAMSRTQILQKIGELLSVRALLNLSGSPHGSGESLLDTPEFYWSKPQLEEYYTKVTRWLDVKPRISLLNQKLDYAGEFANVLRGHLSEQHSLKLEWFIIILIAIEVVFGLVEWAEKLGYVHLTGHAHVAERIDKTLCDCQHGHHGQDEFGSAAASAPMASDEALQASGVVAVRRA
ncbi:hypothetical protein BCR44DRAFT_1043563 [Catenaria anguillulae PL171]|uniref:DUF155 domain-containing protein n=1 Tax=Catenaria anguillulae PL171 TaxID=765915 RepID=A0A1Y2HVX7_9FUNG|nr:hypothetical protein BCR44DRAFT_1043563 [Catenaria anguillulae PL171]